MIYLYVAAFIYGLFYGTWIFYAAFMHIKKNKDLLKEKLGVIGTLYFREIPRELLFTARCSRHMKGTGTQLARATFVCDNLLNPFDKGHCD